MTVILLTHSIVMKVTVVARLRVVPSVTMLMLLELTTIVSMALSNVTTKHSQSMILVNLNHTKRIWFLDTDVSFKFLVISMVLGDNSKSKYRTKKQRMVLSFSKSLMTNLSSVDFMNILCLFFTQMTDG